jgi:hypothetical protein
MRVLYLNDNSVLPHVGCRAVADAHDRLFERLGIEVAFRFFKNDLWWFKKPIKQPDGRRASILEAFGDLIRSVDAVVLNGEGTLHHGGGEDLVSFLRVAQDLGRSTYVINALVQEMHYASDVLSRCTGLVARDPLSLEEVRPHVPHAELAPDSIVFARFEDSRSPAATPRDIVVTDYLDSSRAGAGLIVDKLLMQANATYFPLHSPVTSVTWRNAIGFLTSARCVVSARHHGCYLAAMAGRPFVMLESNSHKMAGLRELFGTFVPFVRDQASLKEAIEEACDHEKRFSALPERIRELDYFGTMTRILGTTSKRTPSRSPLAWFRRIDREPAPPAEQGVPEHALSYAIALLDIRHRRDPRLTPLRRMLRRISSDSDTSRRYRRFWDAFMSAASRRPFLLQELRVLFPSIGDARLLDRICWLAVKRPIPGNEGYSITLEAFETAPSQRSALAHLRMAVQSDVPFDVERAIATFRRLAPTKLTELASSYISSLYLGGCLKDIIAVNDVWRPGKLKPRELLKVAQAYFELGSFDRASDVLLQISSSDDTGIVAGQRLGRLKIHLGDFEDGWPLMNRVVEREHFRAVERTLCLPRWHGDLAAREHLLVWFHDADGLGGEILWSRVLPLFRDCYAGEISIAVDPRLETIFRNSFENIEVLSRSAALSENAQRFDSFVFAREIPKSVIRTESDFERRVSKERLRLPEIASESRQIRSGPTGHINVAIAWKTTNRSSARYRNVPLDPFAAVLAHHRCRFFAIQHGEVEHDLQELGEHLGDRLVAHAIDPKSTIEQIGSALSQMDGVVTIDNTVLHVAGALGIPCLALISMPSYWQWPARGEWSRWYDSVRLLRQEAPGHWEAPLAALDAHLGQLVAERAVVA